MRRPSFPIASPCRGPRPGSLVGQIRHTYACVLLGSHGYRRSKSAPRTPQAHPPTVPIEATATAFGFAHRNRPTAAHHLSKLTLHGSTVSLHNIDKV